MTPEGFSPAPFLAVRWNATLEVALIHWLKKFFSSTGRQTVVLRDVREPGNIRRLSATLTADGGLEISGLDYGDEVEKVFGEREYEWHWRFKAEAVVELTAALQAGDDLLTAMEQKFGGEEHAADLVPFLEKHGIVYEPWSRTGS